MALLDIFSKRQRRVRGEVPDVYAYDRMPQELRVQSVLILRDLLGSYTMDQFIGISSQSYYRTYQSLVQSLCREYGVFQLGQERRRTGDYASELFEFLVGTPNVEQAFDVIELSLRYADRCTRSYEYLGRPDFDEYVNTQIAEINARFLEHGVGYQYEEGELVRLDSDLIHSEAVKPALTLLRTNAYAGPREEFLRAHEHYRHGRHEEALNEALKAFESTMKAICTAKGWCYEPTATAKPLINTCLQNGLVESFWQTQFSSLRGMLESGIATARNKLGGHGQGGTPREVPRELVSYVMHMTASTIVFLIESSERRP